MPIINSRKKTETTAEAAISPSEVEASANGISSAPEVPSQTRPDLSKQKAEPAKPKNSILPVFVIALILCAVGGAYYLFNFAALLDSSTYQPIELDSAEVVQEINRFAKLGGMMSLTEKEIEVNTVTIIEAENAGSTVTMNAVEIILNKNKQELNELREKAIATLAALYNFSLQNQEQTEAIFNEQIDIAQAEEKALRAALLQTALDAVSSVPPIVAPEQHFRGMIEERM